ncbi:unnamed protein product [Didymodactylos carnosus]|uniref:Zinc finger protein n=1 Tax=Didymodactylos carnosus TaxID=1234261 RepID=A0A8S2CMK1_9BILA|nr:unnamed protein product [Didymodactylos carnosus]CAF3504330.1 unnamed protein product [Didymodactylos carnosus]
MSTHGHGYGRRYPFLTRLMDMNYNYGPNYEQDVLEPEFDSDPDLQLSDSELSWQSVTDVDSMSLANHWRGWKGQPVTFGNQHCSTKEDAIPSLVDLSAKTIARTIPFELVDRFIQRSNQPVEESLQLKIAYWSFPENVENIRLYTCVANGSTDEFVKAETLYQSKCVRNVLQIGFHLSADVQEMTTATHPQNVCLRAPVSESLSRLKIDQLRKFAQYLICELPQQILPTAQRLLDDLLSDNPTKINTLQGAPDPTAGPSTSDISVWYLDETILQENISKTLHRFCQPTPQVVGDVTYLTSPSIPAAAEYSSLLRPLRGKEPEGMWNLLQIIAEMLARHDQNGIQLLEILTKQCLAQEQIMQWWFTTKVSNVYNERGTTGLRNHNALMVQQASASLCDEIVHIWRLISLNPLLNIDDRNNIYTKLCNWHINLIEKICKQKTTTTNISTTTNGLQTTTNNYPCLLTATTANGDRSMNQKRRDIDIFSGFLPAIEVAQITWYDFPNINQINVEQNEDESVTAWNKYGMSYDQALTTAYKYIAQQTSSTTASVHPLFNENKDPIVEQQQILPADEIGDSEANNNEKQEQKLNRNSSTENNCDNGSDTDSGGESGDNDADGQNDQSSDEYKIYFADPISSQSATINKTSSSLSNIHTGTTTQHSPLTYEFITLKKINDPLEIAFAQCEALRVHGFSNEAYKLAEQLAKHLLTTNDWLHPPRPPSSSSARRGHFAVSDYFTSPIARCGFLCSILTESPKHQQIAFQIGLCGLEVGRSPSTTKALEIRLLNCEQEICHELKKITLGPNEINMLRDRAEKIRNGITYTRGNALLPLSLATYIFETLRTLSLSRSGKAQTTQQQQQFSYTSCSSDTIQQNYFTSFDNHLTSPPMNVIQQQISTCVNDNDELLGFDAAISALGLKTYVSEGQNPILCEGIRRQRSDLALNLLTLYKDDQTRLIKILEKLLDRDIHILFKNPNMNPFNIGSKKLHTQSTTISSGTTSSVNLEQSHDSTNSFDDATSNRLEYKKTLATAEIDSSGLDESEGENFDQKAWEAKFRCLNLKNSSKRISNGFTSIDSSAPETNSSDNSPTISRRSIRVSSKVNADSESDTCNESPARSITHTDLTPTMNDTSQTSYTPTFCPTIMVDPNTTYTKKMLTSSTSVKSKHKTRSPCIPNQPSEALSHFMFELAKTLVQRAGGTTSTSLFQNTPHITTPPHRNLHLCAFTIALYALGVNNHVHPNWMVRTYSSLVSWITSTAVDIGLQAILILIECWESHLTPLECATASDKASRGRDKACVRAAAELALCSLQYAHALNPAEIRQSLAQCKEQNGDMLERACLTIENASKDGSVYLEVLFDVAKRWYEMYFDVTGDPLTNDEDTQTPTSSNYCFNNRNNNDNSSLSTSSSTITLTNNNNNINHAAQQNYSSPVDLYNTVDILSSYPIYPSASLQNNYTYHNSNNHTNNYIYQSTSVPPPPLSGPLNYHSYPHFPFVPVPIHFSSQPQPTIANTYLTAPFLPTTVFHQQTSAQSLSQSPYNHAHPVFVTTQQQQQSATFPVHTSYSTNQIPIQIYSNLHHHPQQQQQTISPILLSQPSNSYPNNNLRSTPITQINTVDQQPAIVTSPLTFTPAINNTNTAPAASEHISNHRRYLVNAFRVGMLAMSTLARRSVDERRGESNSPTPRHGEDVKWLLKVALKLGNSELQDFVNSATASIINPYLLQALAFSVAYNLSQTQIGSTQMLRSPFLQPLMQKCLNSYTRCVHQRMAHLTTNNDIEEISSLMKNARSAFLLMGNNHGYNDLINFVKGSKKCKKDVFLKIWAAISN